MVVINGTENKLIRYLDIKEQLSKIDKAVEPLNERQKQILTLIYFNEYRASEYIIRDVMNLKDSNEFVYMWDDALIDFANRYYDKDTIDGCYHERIKFNTNSLSYDEFRKKLDKTTSN